MHNKRMEFKTPFIAALFALALFGLERVFKLRPSKSPLGKRLAVNGGMAALTFGAAAILVRPASMKGIELVEQASFGMTYFLKNAFNLPSWSLTVTTFLALDLTFYYWHRINHQIPLLWRFHNAHHMDPDLDVSTAFRFHPGEVAYSSIFRFAQVVIIGPPLWLFLAYEFVFQLGTFFHHSNLRLPRALERWLSFVVVTPRMHGIHHSNIKDETDSNYSVVFSFWDRIHRSFKWKVPQEKITVGVPGYSSLEDNRLGSALLAPFKRQKDYWKGRLTRKGVEFDSFQIRGDGVE